MLERIQDVFDQKKDRKREESLEALSQDLPEREAAYHRLRSVPWDGVEPEVRDLVEAVNLYTRTEMACQGHHEAYDEDWGLPYPWIDIEEGSHNGLETVIEEYNDDAEIEWGFTLDDRRLIPKMGREEGQKPNGETFYSYLEEPEDVSDETPYPLPELQESAQDLAAYLREACSYSDVIDEVDQDTFKGYASPLDGETTWRDYLPGL